MANLAAQTASDTAILEELIRAEQGAIIAYQAAAKTGFLSQAVASVATKIVAQHTEHEKRLTDELTKLGGKAPTPDPSKVTLPPLNNQNDILAFAVVAEAGAANAYFDALRRISPALKQLLASIMSDEAQHAIVLNSALNKPPFNATSFMPIKL